MSVRNTITSVDVQQNIASFLVLSERKSANDEDLSSVCLV